MIGGVLIECMNVIEGILKSVMVVMWLVILGGIGLGVFNGVLFGIVVVVIKFIMVVFWENLLSISLFWG